MSRINIDLPESFAFSTEIDVLIQHINAGQHLANEQLVALLNEARMRFMATLPLAAYHIPLRSFINGDLAVIYKSEARHGDRLKIEVQAGDFHKYGCDFFYRVTQTRDNTAVAFAKTGMLMFDYEHKQLKTVPDNFPALFNR
jgi:acyl-CoA thioester hydrolase